MKSLFNLKFDNTYSQLPGEFYQKIEPTSFENPHLVAFNDEVAELIGLDPVFADKSEFLDYFSGKKKMPGSNPIAMYYTGHQFGVYNKDIGDGRAILLGEVMNSKDEKWDLHLKGAGRTRYARQFDGRTVMRSCIREFLCSETMFHLGMPTTRTLCIIGSDENVHRESPEKGAMLLRVAESHVRFGSFEGFYYSEDYENVKVLADYLINYHFCEIEDANNKYFELFKEIVVRTGELIALWQAYGFTHGVMNTDNMSVLGLTLDYGPFGFVEKFDPEFTPNHSDYHGRYSLRNQKPIGYWNLQKLGKCFSELINDNEYHEALSYYAISYKKKYHGIMRMKLGLQNQHEDDWHLIEVILECLFKSGVDYTNFFRILAEFNEDKVRNNKVISDMFKGTDFGRWAQYYAGRLNKETNYRNERKKLMYSVNPKYVLRNYIAQICIEKALSGDYSEITRVHKMLKNPFIDQPECDEYSRPLPHAYKDRYVSCSS